MQVALRYFAAAGAAVGIDSETLDVTEGSTVNELVAQIRGAHETDADLESFDRVFSLSSFLVNGRTAERTDVVPENAKVDVLPPFAGGGR